MRRILILKVIFLSVLINSCATPRYLVMPNAPSLSEKHTDFSDIDLFITSFRLRNLSDSDNPGDVSSVKAKFIEYIKAQCRFRSVQDLTGDHQQIESSTYITMDIVIEPSMSRYRTWVLDALFFYPFPGYWPLTPSWGDAKVSLTAQIYDDSKGEIERIEEKALQSYNVMFYSWYRVEPVETAFRSAFDKVFDQAARSLASQEYAIKAAAGKNSEFTHSDVVTPDISNSLAADTGSRKKINIALVDLEGKNVSATEASIVSDFLREELFKTNKFTVLERSQMDEILKEQGFQQTGCTDSDCAIKIGRILNVESIVIGSLGRLGNSYIVAARLIDLEKGTMILADRVSHKGPIEDISQSVRKLAEIMASRRIK
ncbi:MAG: CsgG/HfaB family protein [Chitinispirillaceae bacterium]